MGDGARVQPTQEGRGREREGTMGESKVADVPNDADAPEHQGVQQTQDATGVDTFPVGERDSNGSRESRGNRRTDTET